MVLIGRLAALLLAALILSAAPAAAHKGKQHGKAAAAQEPTAQPVSGDDGHASPEPEAAGEKQVANMIGEMGVDRASMPFIERLLSWLGRLHTVMIHFPLAFFPAALFTAVVGRRRPAFAKPVQFLVIAGGLIAPVAALLGWLDGGLTLTDTDPLLRVHRWLGTAIGLAGFALAIWAWKRPDQDRSAGMMAGLAAITAALIVQGWYGGALIHGADHLNW